MPGFKRRYGSVKRRLYSRVKTFGRRRSFKSKSSFKRTKGFKRKSYSRKRSTKKGMSKLFKRRKTSSPFNSNHFATRGRWWGSDGIRRGGGWLRRRVAALDRKIRGGRRGGPRDHLIVTFPSNAVSCDPGLRKETWINLWGTGGDIGTILTNIRAESQFTLTGGAFLYQPTILVSGYSEIEILPAGISPLHYELIVGTSFANNATTLANAATGYASAWTGSYDAQPTDYSFWPSTSVLENAPFWTGRVSTTGAANLRPTHYYKGKIEIGQAKRFVFRFKTRRFTYDEYTNSTFLTDGMARNKSFRCLISCWGDPGQVCGVKSAVNQPIIAELGTQYIMRVRSHYFYKWIAGNNRPTVYGSQYASNESVDDEALGWLGVPALRAQRAGAYRFDSEEGAGFPGFGAQRPQRKHEVEVGVATPIEDCDWQPA